MDGMREKTEMTGSMQEARLSAVGANGFVTAEEVLFLRRNVFRDGVVSREELTALMGLAARAPAGDREWPDFLVEAVGDYFLREEQPHGYLTDEEWGYLSGFLGKEWLGENGSAARLFEARLLVSLAERATSTPLAMNRYAAEAIKSTLRTRQGTHEGAPRIDAETAALVKRLIYAAAGDQSVAVSRQEAEFLFDLNDLCAEADNDPAWRDVFVNAIAAHLMAHVGYRPLAREEAMRLDAFARDQSVKPGRMFGRMFSGGLAALRHALGADDGSKTSLQGQRNAANAKAAAEAELITDTETDWLVERISRDGALHQMERALIAHLKALDAELPPRLKALVDKAA